MKWRRRIRFCCWMCKHSDSVPVLHDDGFHYHGKQRCSARKWRRDVVWNSKLGRHVEVPKRPRRKK